MQVPKNLVVCKYYNSLILSGGKETVFSVWDVTNPAKALFTAKNVRPDTLDLRVPVWLSDASFVEGYEDSLFLTASKYGDFSLYDTRTGQRRPVSRSAWRISRKQGKLSVGSGHSPAVLRDLAVTRPITRVVAFSSGPGVGVRAVAGNAIGDICLLDFRVPRFCLTTSDGDTDTGLSPPLKRRGRSIGNRAPVPPAAVKTFVPASGAVSGLVCGGGGCANLPHASPTCSINDQPIVLSSSLDRFFRVYHRDSGELLSKVDSFNIFFSVSTFLVRKSAQFPLPAGRRKPKKAEKEEENEVQDDDNEETDAIWDKMEPVILKSIPPKRTSDKSDDHLAPQEKKKRAPISRRYSRMGVTGLCSSTSFTNKIQQAFQSSTRPSHRQRLRKRSEGLEGNILFEEHLNKITDDLVKEPGGLTTDNAESLADKFVHGCATAVSVDMLTDIVDNVTSELQDFILEEIKKVDRLPQRAKLVDEVL
ncbi:unnamed protein product [Schistocephalus solidus]|uniref:WD repeat-containing protein 74 n=1 Tax=Schistocephalus solidus TaxID=70667 RepID=A0A183SKN6_SCHSO|nr:unnamed protein product [Schistocephalus solidus]